MNELELIFIGLIIIGIIIFIVGFFLVRNNCNFPISKRIKKPKFCILIPARDESKVIKGLLESILNQTRKVSSEDIYVVVEDINDPTVKIAEYYRVNVFVRKELHLKRKGYALDEVVRDILGKNKHYDAYFIMDADNVMDSNFIKELEQTYYNGYDIGIGYRNCKNGNDSVISACSTLTFTMLNTLGNENKNKQSRNVTISGTGFYIVGSIVESWGSFPFHSLTEDYEMTLYSILHKYKSYYNKKAIFYDEQPVKYKDTINQRVRWIKGYFSSRKIYIKELKKQNKKKHNNYGSALGEIIGVKPYIIMVLGAVLFLLYQIMTIGYLYLNNNTITIFPIIKLIGMLVVIYLVLVIFTSYMLKKEANHLAINKKMKIKTIFINPLFLVTYIPCVLKALLKKEVQWDKIEHCKQMVIK